MADKIKRVLVTGASGKIGRNLIPALLEAGYTVRVTQFRTPVTFDGVEVVKGSVSDEAFAKQAVEGMDAVCHLATQKEDREALIEVSVRGTLNLLDACRHSPTFKQFIISSGDAAQGIYFYPNPVPIREDMGLRAYPGYYALSKVMEDTLVEQYGIQYALPYTILRFSWIFDEDDILAYMTFRKPDFGGPSWKSLAKTPEQKAFFEKDEDGVGCLMHPDPAGGAGGKPYLRHIVGIGDVVGSIVFALGNPKALGQTFNVAAPEPFRYDALADDIAKKLGIPRVDFEFDEAHDFAIDVTKVKTVLGYVPEWGITRIVDDAIAFRKSRKTRSDAAYSG